MPTPPELFRHSRSQMRFAGALARGLISSHTQEVEQTLLSLVSSGRGGGSPDFQRRGEPDACIDEVERHVKYDTVSPCVLRVRTHG